MVSPHQKNLEDLCRVCGERLQKSKGAVTSKFQCLKWRDFLAEKFSIFVEKDLEEIHPQYFCHACYAHPDRKTVGLATWVTHYDDSCSVCSHAAEIKKGGRPKKARRGRKPDLPDPSRTQNPGLNPLQDLDALTKDLPSLRFADFSEKFSFPESLRKDLVCPVCLQILDKPVETTCQHYFCVECIKGVIDSGQSGSCPVCKEKIGLLKIPTRMVLRLIAEQEVACKKCGKNVHYEDSAAHVCGDTRVWKGILGIRGLTKIRCGIRENAKYLDGIRDLPATREAGFAKIWARDVGFCCLSVRNSGNRKGQSTS